MSLHHSFMWHLLKEDKGHIRPQYFSVYLKEIYPVAFNPLDDGGKAKYEFGKDKRFYRMIR